MNARLRPMGHLLKRGLLLCCLLLCVLSPPVQASETIKIATFNCHWLVRKNVHAKFGLNLKWSGVDADTRALWQQQEYRDARFNEAAKAVAAVITRIDADIIVLTEVGNKKDVDELHREVESLGVDYPHVAVCASSDTLTGQHVAVFSKRELSQVQHQIDGRESYYEELDDPDSENDTGISKGMRVVFELAGSPVCLYALHLKSELGGHESDAKRIAQASIVRRHYLEDLWEGNHVIVIGDLNDGRGEPTLKRIRGLDDIDEDLMQLTHPRFFKRNVEGLAGRWTYTYQGLRQQIDHILISRSFYEQHDGTDWLTHEFVEAVETTGTTENRASDHRAFAVTLRIKPKSTEE